MARWGSRMDVLNSPAATAALASPLVSSIIFVAVAIIAAIAAGTPLMGFYRDWRKTKADAAQSGAEEARALAEQTLYHNLQKQIEANSKAIAELQAEKECLHEGARLLRSEVERLKAFEKQITQMKARLEDKDRIIEERDREIRELTKVILKMKDQIHALELKLQIRERNGITN